jgi:hypothetical protein
MSSAIAFDHVDVIFGREAQAALAMLGALLITPRRTE